MGFICYFNRISPPTTPPASSSGFGGSCSTTLTANAVLANELNSAPLSGTAEEKISREDLKRRRSSGLGGSGKRENICLNNFKFIILT